MQTERRGRVRTIREIAYRRTPHERGTGDLHLPEDLEDGASPVLLIHGGGWNALQKESIESFTTPFVESGRAVFNINYRLLRHAPWPACLEDCLAAAECVREGGLASHGIAAGQSLLVCGASAGGHLAMMTGLRLGRGRAEAIISLCGPAMLDFPDGSTQPRFESRQYTEEFFGDARIITQVDIDRASPARIADADAPPLYCIHSRNDRLVPVSHSFAAVEAWRAAGVEAEAFIFKGPGDSHGIWDSEDRAIRQPIGQAADSIRQILARLNAITA